MSPPPISSNTLRKLQNNSRVVSVLWWGVMDLPPRGTHAHTRTYRPWIDDSIGFFFLARHCNCYDIWYPFLTAVNVCQRARQNAAARGPHLATTPIFPLVYQVDNSEKLGCDMVNTCGCSLLPFFICGVSCVLLDLYRPGGR